MTKTLLVQQLESSVDFLAHRLNVERDPAELTKLTKELSQAKGSLANARLVPLAPQVDHD